MSLTSFFKDETRMTGFVSCVSSVVLEEDPIKPSPLPAQPAVFCLASSHIPSVMSKIIECVPNFSEGRDPTVV